VSTRFCPPLPPTACTSDSTLLPFRQHGNRTSSSLVLFLGLKPSTLPSFPLFFLCAPLEFSWLTIFLPVFSFFLLNATLIVIPNEPVCVSISLYPPLAHSHILVHAVNFTSLSLFCLSPKLIDCPKRWEDVMRCWFNISCFSEDI